MRGLIKFLSCIIFFGFMIATAIYFLNHEYYGQNEAGRQAVSNSYKNYSITKFSNGPVIPKSNADRPDLLYLNSKHIISKPQEFVRELVSVEKLQVGVKKLRGKISQWGEMQERLDPLSIVLEKGVYNLEMITETINDKSLLEKIDQNIYVLYVPLSLNADASLFIQEETLLLSSNRGALISSFGNITMDNAVIKGWNTEKNKPSYFEQSEKFRPYVVSWCGANLDIKDSELAYLGYSESKSYGITYTSCSHTVYEDDYPDLMGSQGSIVNSKITDTYFGFYSYEAQNVSILGNHYDKNIVYGIDPHDRSRNIVIADNKVTNTREKHGIILSRDVTNTHIVNNVVEGNFGSGIMLDRNSHTNIVSGNVVKNNKGDGISVYESADNVLENNVLSHNGGVGMRVRNSWGVISLNDHLQSNIKGGVQLYTAELKNRDTDIDPYQKRAGLELVSTEIIDQKDSVFKLEKFDRFVLNSPKIYKSGERVFKGDLKNIENYVSEALFAGGSVLIEQKH